MTADMHGDALICRSKLYEPAELGKLYGLSTFKFLILADEAHAMQSLTSQRTQAALKLCLHAQCIGAVLATGTPMKNGRPSNILPLLIAIRHPIARNKLEFEKRYCNAKKTRFCAWDTSGASNLEELRKNIGPHLLRKTKVSYCLRSCRLAYSLTTRATISVAVSLPLCIRSNSYAHRNIQM